MENQSLPAGFEWCRKTIYNVQVELGCYPITESQPLLEGFEEEIININGEQIRYATKKGFNVLEQNNWKTTPDRPFIITGTVGERWPVKPTNMTAYDVDIASIGIEPMTISTKDPKGQEFLVAFHIPVGQNVKITPKWAFSKDGTVDETQVMVANSESSSVSHLQGDYVVAKHIEGKPEFMQLSEKERMDPSIIVLYDPRVINGSIMETTYDHAPTQEEINEKYGSRAI